MILTIDAKLAAGALSHISNVIPRAGAKTLPILACTVIRASVDGRVEFLGTNMDQQASAIIVAEHVEAGGSVAVNAAALSAVLRAFRGDVSLQLDGGALKVLAGRARKSLPVLPASDWAGMSEIGQSPGAINMPADALARALESVSPSMSDEETRYYLNGVYFEPAAEAMGAGIELTATDGTTLATYYAADLKAEFEPFILPRQAVKDVIALAKRYKTTELTLLVDGDKFCVETPNERYTSKLVDGTFPDWRRVYPKSEASTYTMVPHVFAEAVGRVNAGEMDAKSPSVGLRAGAGELDLCSNTANQPPSLDRVDMEIALMDGGSGASVYLNSALLVRALGVMPKTGARMLVVDENTAVRFEADEFPLRQVIMPLRGTWRGLNEAPASAGGA